MAGWFSITRQETPLRDAPKYRRGRKWTIILALLPLDGQGYVLV